MLLLPPQTVLMSIHGFIDSVIFLSLILGLFKEIFKSGKLGMIDHLVSSFLEKYIKNIGFNQSFKSDFLQD